MVKLFRPEFITDSDGMEYQSCMTEPDSPEDALPHYVLHSDYAALEAKCRELEAENREFALNEAKMRTGWWIQNYQELHAKVATRDAVLRKIVETAQEHPAKANFVEVHWQIVGEARELLGTPSERKVDDGPKFGGWNPDL